MTFMEKNRMHVTIIDDNKDLLEVLSSSLADSFTIESFTEPDKGLEFIRNNHTDAILLDLHIPGKDGFEIYEEVKRAKQNLPVLFLTGDSDISARCPTPCCPHHRFDYCNIGHSHRLFHTRGHTRLCHHHLHLCHQWHHL